MTIVETFADFVSAVAKYTDSGMPYDWRAGQGAFYLLMKVRPEIGELLRGSDFDPFMDNARLPLFYDFVMRHWNDGEI